MTDDTTPTAAPTPARMPGAVPSPALMAKRQGAPTASAFGRVDEQGVVYVKTADGEREVGSYPGAGPQEALTYFTRKFDDVMAQVSLLKQRVSTTDISAKEAQESLDKLKTQIENINAVGDLAALEHEVEAIEVQLSDKREAEKAQRAVAREQATAKRKALVEEAEQIAGQPEEKTQWKNSSTRMRELLDEWKTMQRSGVRLEKEVEQGLWSRLSAARNSFDRARRNHFAQLDAVQGEAKAVKTRLVAEAERLAQSTDWAATAGEFKRLMDQWRRAGRAGRSDDDALWARFKSAQDAFFSAKDAVVAAEEESFKGNLAVKLELLKEAESILPVTDIERAKAQLRVVQDKWEKAGKVPRADIDRTEKGMRRVEQAVRDAEEKKWAATNPEVAARANSLVTQLEKAIACLEEDLAKAEASGNDKRIKQAREALDARQAWLAQARAGLEEFGG